MNEYCVDLLEALMRSGLALSMSAAFVLLFLRVFPVASPRMRRIAYFAVILQGCLLIRIPVTISPIHAVSSSVQQPDPDQAISQAPLSGPSFAAEIAETFFTTDLIPVSAMTTGRSSSSTTTRNAPVMTRYVKPVQNGSPIMHAHCCCWEGLPAQRF